MPFTNADYLALKAELTNDPLSLGLTTLPADDEANANALNLVRVTIQIDRESIPVSEIAKAIDRDEYNAASAADRDYIKMVTSGGDVNPKTGSEVREGLLQIFGAGTESRASLNALLTEPGSRITQLFKLGTLSYGGAVTPSDIANARNAV
jgi:hypothetical protein